MPMFLFRWHKSWCHWADLLASVQMNTGCPLKSLVKLGFSPPSGYPRVPRIQKWQIGKLPVGKVSNMLHWGSLSRTCTPELVQTPHSVASHPPAAPAPKCSCWSYHTTFALCQYLLASQFSKCGPMRTMGTFTMRTAKQGGSLPILLFIKRPL